MSVQVRGLCAWGCGRPVWERPGYSAHLNLAPQLLDLGSQPPAGLSPGVLPAQDQLPTYMGSLGEASQGFFSSPCSPPPLEHLEEPLPRPLSREPFPRTLGHLPPPPPLTAA